jgi:UDP-GlcNAc:undecaprenyl-phosphate/decaprenyl-phosphate GlcNAc-1-phosphate transferase
MSGVNALGYAGVFVACLALSYLFTPLALRLALRREIVDHPGGYKAQESPVPYLGGAAIVTAFALVVVAAAVIRPPVRNLDELFIIMGLAVGLAVVGLLDDLYGLNVWFRFGLQAVAGGVLWWAGVTTQLVDLGPVDLLITVLWIVGITNAFNLLDNMDGLSAGVAGIAALSFFVIAAVNGQFLVATLALALAGCVGGFLRHNFHPARIYMGDAGSLFIGFLLATIAIKLTFPAGPPVTLFVPLLVLGIALLDTTLVVVTRLLHQRNPLAGGRDHISHRLVFIGVPVPASVGLIYAAAISLGWLALVMVRLEPMAAWLLMGLVLALALFLGVLLGMVPVYETSKRRRVMLQEVVEHEPEPPAAVGTPEGAGAGPDFPVPDPISRSG